MMDDSGCAQFGIDNTKSINGLDGIHIMGIDWEESIPKLVQCAESYLSPKGG